MWKLVADPLSGQERDWLTTKVRAYLGEMDVEIQLVDEIPPGRSGKFQYVVRRD